MEKPLVSVLMTAYNREKYIAEAIESVLASTYQNWELIIVDDCSKDRTVAIARLFEAKDERIKVYVNEQNLGDYPNRNKAAEHAKGKYLKYLDSDDLIYYYGLEVMVNSMELFPEAAIGISHSKTDESYPYPHQVSPEEAYIEHFMGRGLFNYGPSAMIIKKDKFDAIGGFSSERFLGDGEFLLRIGAKYPTVKMAPALVWWRQHGAQEIGMGKDSGYYMENTFKFNLQYLNSRNCPLNHQEKNISITRQKQHHARKLLSMMLRVKEFKLAWKIFRKSELSIFELLKGFKNYA